MVWGAPGHRPRTLEVTTMEETGRQMEPGEVEELEEAKRLVIRAAIYGGRGTLRKWRRRLRVLRGVAARRAQGLP